MGEKCQCLKTTKIGVCTGHRLSGVMGTCGTVSLARCMEMSEMDGRRGKETSLYRCQLSAGRILV